MRWGQAASIILITGFLAVPVQAGSEIETLINMLHENGTVSDEQYDRLMAELKQNQNLQQQQQDRIETQLAEVSQPDDVEVKINGGGLSLNTRDGAFTTKLGGRLQLDAASYQGQPRQGDGTEVRRAYLTLQGKMYHDWGYRLQYNFANTGSDGKGILDAYIDYKGFEWADVRVGHFKEPFTLHEATSDNFVTFTERATVAVFSPGRKLGVMASQKFANWTWAASIAGESVSTKGGSDDEGWGISSRVTFAPIQGEGELLHLGLGANYRDTGSANTVRFRQQAETHIAGVNIVDTGAITNSDQVLKLGAELATVMGPFSAQAEYISTAVERQGMADLDFEGWYVETGYFLTGESRRYKAGKFLRPNPESVVGNGGIGAWQLAGRYSTLDLSDGLIEGGEVYVMTLGVNWYPTSTLRFTANYVDVLDVKGGPNDGKEPRLFQVRSQWAF